MRSAEERSLFSEIPYTPMTTVRDLLTSYTAAAICPGSSDSLRLPSMMVCSGLAIMITPFRACWCEEWCEIFMPYRNLILVRADG